MKIIADEKSFKSVIEGKERVLVFFYVEKGCGFCDKMKPVLDEISEEIDVIFYKCSDDLRTAITDSVSKEYVKAFPTFAAFENGKLIATQSGGMSKEQVLNTFHPEMLPKKIKKLTEASMLELLTDEANLIDQIGPMRSHLAKIQAEIAKRKKMAMGKVDCCDSCADGGECDGGCH